jgi:hypothetical protein
VPARSTTGCSCGADSQQVTSAARRRREQPDADQVEEPGSSSRYPVEAVDELVDHVGEHLDEGDAGVGDVVVGPLRTTLLDEPLGFVDELLETAVVEVRCWQGHQAALPSSVDGMT